MAKATGDFLYALKDIGAHGAVLGVYQAEDGSNQLFFANTDMAVAGRQNREKVMDWCRRLLDRMEANADRLDAEMKDVEIPAPLPKDKGQIN